MNQTAILLERLSALLQQSVRDDAAGHGLLPIHLQVLHYLARANRYSDLPIAIAEYFGITRGTVSQTLQVLERKGLLTKKPDPQHGKRVHLQLTAAARRVLQQTWAERVVPLPEELPPPMLALESTLRTLLLTMQRINGRRAFGICHECIHFLTEASGHRCGLTGEVLADEQTLRICREWTAPATRAAIGKRVKPATAASQPAPRRPRRA